MTISVGDKLPAATFKEKTADGPVEITTDAFEARAVQHEVDHCAGLLFLDRVAGAHAVYPRKVYL